MEYFEHKATQTMFTSNLPFYKEVWQSGYNISCFARKMLRGRWCGESIVRYFAFGVTHYPREEILKTLDEEYQNWRGEFVWQVLCWEVERVIEVLFSQLIKLEKRKLLFTLKSFALSGL